MNQLETSLSVEIKHSNALKNLQKVTTVTSNQMKTSINNLQKSFLSLKTVKPIKFTTSVENTTFKPYESYRTQSSTFKSLQPVRSRSIKSSLSYKLPPDNKI